MGRTKEYDETVAKIRLTIKGAISQSADLLVSNRIMTQKKKKKKLSVFHAPLPHPLLNNGTSG